MIFKIRDESIIRKIGVRELFEAARNLPRGKVIEVKKSELPYNARLVLAQICRTTRTKFALTELKDSVVFSRSAAMEQPTVSLSPTMRRHVFTHADREKAIVVRNSKVRFPYVSSLRSLAREAGGEFYGPPLIKLCRENSGVVVSKKAWKSTTAKNSCICDLRKSGFSISGTNRSSRRIVIRPSAS